MSVIQAGQPAPLFTLPSADGETFSLGDLLKRGPVFLVFFKILCPTCQFTFPFIERLHRRFAADPVTFLGISQDDAEATAEFRAEYGVTFPALIDPEQDVFPVSREYGITNAPTFYLIASDGNVLVESVGFSRKALEQIAAWLAQTTGHPSSPLFLPEEIIPESKQGCGSKN